MTSTNLPSSGSTASPGHTQGSPPPAPAAAAQPQADAPQPAPQPALEDLDLARAAVDAALTDVDGDLARAAARLATLVDQYVAPRLAARRRRMAAAREGNRRRYTVALGGDRNRGAALMASRRWDQLGAFTQAVVRARLDGLTWTQIGVRLETTRDVAYGTWRRLPRPGYPDIGSLIPPDRNGGQAGYIVAACTHRVAGSEWDAGFANCERCGN